MPTPTGYVFICFTVVSFYLPMPIISELFTLFVYIAGPLFARATSEDAAQIAIGKCNGAIRLFGDLAVVGCIRQDSERDAEFDKSPLKDIRFSVKLVISGALGWGL
ncbi:hypothetical protein GGR58DRAFT_505278 [Xylaria digitata]|nr:hypothetical protein GGR58DRAFT_505278 [Xylaria digitata]